MTYTCLQQDDRQIFAELQNVQRFLSTIPQRMYEKSMVIHSVQNDSNRERTEMSHEISKLRSKLAAERQKANITAQKRETVDDERTSDTRQQSIAATGTPDLEPEQIGRQGRRSLWPGYHGVQRQVLGSDNHQRSLVEVPLQRESERPTSHSPPATGMGSWQPACEIVTPSVEHTPEGEQEQEQEQEQEEEQEHRQGQIREQRKPKRLLRAGNCR